MGREPRKVSGNYITIDRGSYKFIIKSKERKKLTEIIVYTRKQKIEDILIEIREKLK